MVHRITHVLRVQVGDSCILFNQAVRTISTIIAISKKSIAVETTALAPNSMWSPSLTFYLPLLKREALEHAIYGLTELGATEIQLDATQ